MLRGGFACAHGQILDGGLPIPKRKTLGIGNPWKSPHKPVRNLFDSREWGTSRGRAVERATPDRFLGKENSGRINRCARRRGEALLVGSRRDPRVTKY